MEVKKDIRNELFGRREVQLILESPKNPTFPEATKLLADNFKTAEENVMVENVKGKFGRKTFLLKASIYDTKELKEEAVKRLIKQKKAKPGEAPAT